MRFCALRNTIRNAQNAPMQISAENTADKKKALAQRQNPRSLIRPRVPRHARSVYSTRDTAENASSFVGINSLLTSRSACTSSSPCWRSLLVKHIF